MQEPRHIFMFQMFFDLRIGNSIIGNHLISIGYLYNNSKKGQFCLYIMLNLSKVVEIYTIISIMDLRDMINY